MSQDLYNFMFRPGATLLHAFAQAGRLRRAARELAAEESEEFVEAEPEEWAILTRLAAAEDAGTSLQVTPEPVPIEATPGWAVMIRLEPTIDGAAMLHATRLRAGADTTESPPAVQIRIRVDGQEEQLLIPSEEDVAARFLEAVPQGLLEVRAMREG